MISTYILTALPARSGFVQNEMSKRKNNRKPKASTKILPETHKNISRYKRGVVFGLLGTRTWSLTDGRPKRLAVDYRSCRRVRRLEMPSNSAPRRIYSPPDKYRTDAAHKYRTRGGCTSYEVFVISFALIILYFFFQSLLIFVVLWSIKTIRRQKDIPAVDGPTYNDIIIYYKPYIYRVLKTYGNWQLAITDKLYALVFIILIADVLSGIIPN